MDASPPSSELSERKRSSDTEAPRDTHQFLAERPDTGPRFGAGPGFRGLAGEVPLQALTQAGFIIVPLSVPGELTSFSRTLG